MIWDAQSLVQKVIKCESKVREGKAPSRQDNKTYTHNIKTQREGIVVFVWLKWLVFNTALAVTEPLHTHTQK